MEKVNFEEDSASHTLTSLSQLVDALSRSLSPGYIAAVCCQGAAADWLKGWRVNDSPREGLQDLLSG